MSLRFPLLLLGIAITTACSQTPSYNLPALPVSFDSTTSTQLQADWQSFYQEPKLKQLFELALEHNRDLRQAALRSMAFRAQYQIRHSERYPDLSVQGQSSRQRLPTMNGGNNISQQSALEIGVAAYELDFFGRIKSLEQAALNEYQASVDDEKTIKLALLSDVATSWLTLIGYQQQCELLYATLVNYQQNLNLQQALAAEGIASAIAVDQARLLLNQAQAELNVYQRLSQQEQHALELLVGTTLPVTVLSAVLPELPPLPAELTADVLLQRPDIRAAEQRLYAANANVAAARAAFYPSIRLTATAGTSSQQLDDLFSAGSGSWRFIPQLSLPIFNGGRLAASLDYARVQQDIRVTAYEKTIQQAFREVKDALSARTYLNDQVLAQRQLVATAGRLEKQADARYQAGLDSFLTVLEARRSLLSAEQQLIQTSLLQLRNEVYLLKALGGGV